jgi:hypothetical protein
MNPTSTTKGFFPDLGVHPSAGTLSLSALIMGERACLTCRTLLLSRSAAVGGHRSRGATRRGTRDTPKEPAGAMPARTSTTQSSVARRAAISGCSGRRAAMAAVSDLHEIPSTLEYTYTLATKNLYRILYSFITFGNGN